jgi:hypothetical protein
MPDLARLLKPPPAHIVNPYHGATIWRVKLPGQPVQTMASFQFKERYPRLYPKFRSVKLGETRILKVRLRRRKAVRIGVQALHPNQLSQKARARICPWGIRGEMRRMFIEEGVTPSEFRARPEFRLSVDAHMREVTEQYYKDHPEEQAYKLARRERKREAQNKQLAKQGRPAKIDYSKFINPGQIAKHLGVPPLEVRKFLRKHRIGKRGGRYAFTRKETRKLLRVMRKEIDGAE